MSSTYSSFWEHMENQGRKNSILKGERTRFCREYSIREDAIQQGSMSDEGDGSGRPPPVGVDKGAMKEVLAELLGELPGLKELLSGRQTTTGAGLAMPKSRAMAGGLA